MKALDVLNVTNMTSRRKDGHSSLYYLGPKVGPAPLHRQDCSHWCLPGVPDTWNELLYALFLKREATLTRNSSTFGVDVWFGEDNACSNLEREKWVPLLMNVHLRRSAKEIEQIFSIFQRKIGRKIMGLFFFLDVDTNKKGKFRVLGIRGVKLCNYTKKKLLVLSSSFCDYVG